jgi:predicted phosphodiesterase
MPGYDLVNSQGDPLVDALAAPPVDTTEVVGESELHDPKKGSSFTRFSRVAWGYEDYVKFIAEKGMDPEKVTFTWGWTSNPNGGFWNKLNNVRPIAEDGVEPGVPAWPLVQPADPIVIKPTKVKKTPKATKWKTAIVGSDTQFGYRYLDDDTAEEFHDEAAISVFHQIVAAENPDQTIIAGDIGDFAAQGTFVQENGFARNTQPTINRMGLFAAQLRADTDGKIVWIEGNHDKRLQKFVEMNSASSLGLKKANWPDSYPVMSIPNLCRLDEFDIIYKDAYPAAHWWINERLRAEHGDRSNSNGSTAEKYARETPHISRVFGHSHRLEKISRTTYDRQGSIRSKFINTGCLCRTDGTVPSTHGAKGADGRSATVYENWQNGLVIFRYRDDGDFFTDLIEIEDGFTHYNGQDFSARV